MKGILDLEYGCDDASLTLILMIKIAVKTQENHFSEKFSFFLVLSTLEKEERLPSLISTNFAKETTRSR